MTTYIIRRLIQAVIVLILVTAFVFFAMRLLPGDPIRMLVSRNQEQRYSEEEVQSLRRQYGLDKPLVVQYGDWISHVVRGDLGVSILERVPVTEQLKRRVPITLHLGVLAFLISIIIGIPLGVVSAIRRGKWIDTLFTTLANVGITVPVFWLGVILMYFFGLHLRWLPIMGYTSPFDDFWLSTKQLIMPVFCLALFGIAGNARQTRSAMLEVMHQDYVRTAWSKGLRERVIIIRHALKNGLIPVVTLFGAGIGQILGGSVLIEQVFAIPGMGRLALTAVTNQDYTYVQAIILIIACMTLAANLIVDLSYGWLDPRIRYG
ncbi:MAG: ABC transporter permease [Dehalococcoidales bacterium]|nr:ABC transporter permease [Dehalococcoidales bacterium]